MQSLKLAFAFCLFFGLVIAVHAWLTARRDAQMLKQTLATQSKILSAADSDKRKNDSDLQNALQQIDALKRRVRTPAAAVRSLNQFLPLPVQLVYRPTDGTLGEAVAAKESGGIATAPHDSTAAELDGLPSSPTAKISSVGGSAVVPGADLLALNGYVQGCRACSAELSAARANSLDDQNKIAALVAERDAAVKASRNGSLAGRIKGSAAWIAVGAGIGFVVAVSESDNRPRNH
jgi:hypothetical protein